MPSPSNYPDCPTSNLRNASAFSGAPFVYSRKAVASGAIGSALVLAAAAGFAGSVAGLALLRPFVEGLGLEGPAADYAVTYLRPMFALLTFRVIEVGGVACLVGAGDTRTGLFVRGGVAVVNLPLGWALFHAIGFQGIALGTAITYE